MQKVILEVGFAAILVVLVGANTGCSAIGYYVGGAIHGEKYEVDTVLVSKDVDSIDAEFHSHSSVERQRFASLMHRAEPGNNSRLDVITSNCSFTGNALSADTVVALKHEPDRDGRAELLPGDPVDLTLRDSGSSRIHGTLVRLSERNIVLRVDDDDRGYSLNNVNAISLNDEWVVLSGEDLASPNFCHRLIRVPGLVLGQESPRLFIPLREVEQIRVTRPVIWSSGQTTGFVVGGIVDFACMYTIGKNLYPKYRPSWLSLSAVYFVVFALTR